LAITNPTCSAVSLR